MGSYTTWNFSQFFSADQCHIHFMSLPMNLFGGRREKQIILLASGGEHLLVRHIFFASSLNFSHKNLRMWIEVFGLSCKCTTCFLCHSLLVFIVTASIELDFVPVSLQLRSARSHFIFKGNLVRVHPLYQK